MKLLCYIIAFLLLVVWSLADRIRAQKHEFERSEERYNNIISEQDERYWRHVEVYNELRNMYDQRHAEYMKEIDFVKKRAAELQHDNEILSKRLSRYQGERQVSYYEANPYYDFVQYLPKDVKLEKGFIPVKGSPDCIDPFGDYSIFVADGESCYHSYRFCGDSVNRARHLFDYVSTHVPCKKCFYGKIDTEVPWWFLKAKESAMHSSGKESILKQENERFVFYCDD